MPSPSQSGPPLPEGQVPEDAEKVEKVSSSEKRMLIAVAIMLFILFLCAVVFPHLPFTAEL